MRMRMLLGITVLAAGVAGCQDVTAPEPVAEPAEAAVVAMQGPSNRCYGEVVSGIASTWPFAHDDRLAFPPPPGALALWVKEFGPGVGISNVRELQLLFCGT